MNKKFNRVMIVDDSAFARTLLKDILENNGYDVVGEADSLKTAVKTYSNFKPDIVTMDIAMPGADGFECSRALLLINPKVKIILVSSIMDNATETEARRVGISGYVQKPVDEKTLIDVIENIFSPDSLFEELQRSAIDTFKETLAQTITSMTKSVANFNSNIDITTEYSSQGITTVIGIIGRYSGTMIMDLSLESAGKIAKAILKREPNDKEEILSMSSELANIVAGSACSVLNRNEKSYGFRVSPPSLFHGESTQIASPNIEIQGSHVETDSGKIFLGIGFKKGNVLWT